MQAGSFENAGVIDAGSGSRVSFDAALTSVAGSTLTGDGTIAANGLILAAGLVSPGAGLDETADLTLDNNVDFADTTLFDVQIGGPFDGQDFDEFVVTMNLLLDGVLSVNLTNGFTPDAADTFEVAEALAITGAFDNVANGGTLLTDDGLGSFVVNYGSGSAFDPDLVVLSNFTEIPEPTTFALLAPAAGLLLRRRRTA